MIEGRVIPVRWVVAGGAVCSEFAVVFIIPLMTGETICGCALVNIILMTLLTTCFSMFAFEFETERL
jgi:hypothetical protein